MHKQIKRALISVYNKENLNPLIAALSSFGVEIYSTGGTQSFIEKQGYAVKAIEALTGYPSILGGRVKTLHPKVFGGILVRSDEDDDLNEIEKYEIPAFDLVIVDLYPFEDTIASTNNENTIIEKIDIGGIALIRAAAKNYMHCLVVPSQNYYTSLLNILNDKKGVTSLEDRRKFAAAAFGVSSNYDTAIFNHFNKTAHLEALRISYSKPDELRYGENPHQKGYFYGPLNELLTQVHGKAISYNNLLDIDAAVNIIEEFDSTTFAILKHNNTCGLASNANLTEAYKMALAGDPISAFGGVLICNDAVDATTASLINELFFEVLIAPSFIEDALEILKSKKNRILLIKKQTLKTAISYRSVLNGLLYQQKDNTIEIESNWNFCTEQQPSEQQKKDLLFALKAVKNLKSNGIALVKNEQLVGMGCGQTSRIDALNHAIKKAKDFNLNLEGAVMASDAFFPFPDCVEIAYNAGIKAVIQPGGSIKDKASIAYCNRQQMAMVLTGVRHFKH